MAGTVNAYSEEHPHYTPQWLSEELATALSHVREGTVLDPACGTGNLLLAVGAKAITSNGKLALIGVDTHSRALSSFKEAAAKHLTGHRVRTIHKDFLQLTRKNTRFGQPLHLIMNPPFAGYGALSANKRNRISSELGMGGRFNLAHAFVVHAIENFRPDSLVALLPCTWARSRSSQFRLNLHELGGTWAWRELGNNPFKRVSTHVGILTWQADAGSNNDIEISDCPETRAFPFEMRIGTATGRDTTYREIASYLKGKRVGQIVNSVRGRDVGRNTSTAIWMPPREQSGLRIAERKLPEDLTNELSQRACVRKGIRGTLEFQEKVQNWFLGEPKLILPEINTGDVLRVTADLDGNLLPLHSTLAIRTRSKTQTREIKKLFESKGFVTQLRGISPRLQGTSFRLTVRALRSLEFDK